MKLTRRLFMSLPALAIGWEQEHTFHFDHVIGTSLDLAVWTKSREAAENASRVALAEIARLSRILSTYEPESEIRRVERGNMIESPELAAVFALYQNWEKRTGGILSIRPSGTRLNVDAIGKAYIINRAAAAIRSTVPQVRSFVLNIGGDLVVSGRDCEVNITDPGSPHDNAEPLTKVVLHSGEAISTSGFYARGAHLFDARTGKAPESTASATVVASDIVTANALATTLCISDVTNLVERIPGAEALRITSNGALQRTSGFARREVRKVRRQQPASAWPSGFEVGINLTLTTPDPRLDRSYVAFWVEDMQGKLVRAIVLWGTKQQYHDQMSGYWKITGGDKTIQYRVTRATRAPGNYRVVWNGMDEQNKAAPRGTYRIVVETNRYHGDYARATATIACENEPASVVIPDKRVNFESIKITYGPKPAAA